MKTLTKLVLALLITTAASAKVSVLFHPYDDTFSAIVERLKKAEKTIDMALYNLDASQRSSIIQYFSSSAFQRKLERGDISVRLIFEGYASPEENLEKMLSIEKLGIDVKTLRTSKKMHHKFAVIDGHSIDPSVITGSANWSSSSRDNYNENILFFDGEAEMAQKFQKEFNLLWGVSKEVGKTFKHEELGFEKAGQGPGEVFFNTDNFEVRRGTLYKKNDEEGFRLTKEIVRSIDDAETKIEVATTRLKLRPIYNALLRAAKRGVEIKVVVTMGEYEWYNKRRKMVAKKCADEFEKNCSSGENYAALLDKGGFEGAENVSVRLKFFHLKTSAYLSKQMHSKYLIIDDTKVLTGSFNWSYSSEYNHIENVVELDQKEARAALKGFNDDFDHLFEMRRGGLSGLHEEISESQKAGKKMDCGFEPMALSYKEVDGLLKRGRKFCL